MMNNPENGVSSSGVRVAADDGNPTTGSVDPDGNTPVNANEEFKLSLTFVKPTKLGDTTVTLKPTLNSIGNMPPVEVIIKGVKEVNNQSDPLTSQSATLGSTIIQPNNPTASLKDFTNTNLPTEELEAVIIVLKFTQSITAILTTSVRGCEKGKYLLFVRIANPIM